MPFVYHATCDCRALIPYKAFAWAMRSLPSAAPSCLRKMELTKYCCLAEETVPSGDFPSKCLHGRFYRTIEPALKSACISNGSVDLVRMEREGKAIRQA